MRGRRNFQAHGHPRRGCGFDPEPNGKCRSVAWKGALKFFQKIGGLMFVSFKIVKVKKKFELKKHLW